MYTDVQFTWSTATWTHDTSTGASTKVCDVAGLLTCRNITITIETPVTADTCVVGIEHARTSTSPFQRMGSTAYVLNSSLAPESLTIQLEGPLFAVRPYLISRTNTATKVVVALAAA